MSLINKDIFLYFKEFLLRALQRGGIQCKMPSVLTTAVSKSLDDQIYNNGLTEFID